MIDATSNLKMIQDGFKRASVDWQYDKCKVDNALVYHILSNISKEADAFIQVKQRKSSLDS